MPRMNVVELRGALMGWKQQPEFEALNKAIEAVHGNFSGKLAENLQKLAMAIIEGKKDRAEAAITTIETMLVFNEQVYNAITPDDVNRLSAHLRTVVESQFEEPAAAAGGAGVQPPGGAQPPNGEDRFRREAEKTNFEILGRFIQYVRDQMGFPEFLEGVDLQRTDFTPQERARFQSEFDVALAKILIDHTLRDKFHSNSGLPIAGGTWDSEGHDFFIMASYQGVNAPRKGKQYIDALPSQFRGYFSNAFDRVQSLAGNFNLAFNIGAGGNRPPMDHIQKVYDAQQGKSHESLFKAGNYEGTFSEVRIGRYERATAPEKTSWLLGEASRLAMLYQDRVSRRDGYTVVGKEIVNDQIQEKKVQIPVGFPYGLNSNAGDMYNRLLEATRMTIEWEQDRLDENGRPRPLTPIELWQIEAGVKWAVLVSRAHLIEAGSDKNAVEFEASQLLLSWFYHGLEEKKTGPAADANKYYGPDVGKVRSRYLETVEGISRMYAVVPAEAIEILNTADQMREYLTRKLEDAYGTKDKKKKSLEYRDVIRSFTQYRFFDSQTGQTNYDRMAREFRAFRVKKEFQQIQTEQEAGDYIFIPEHSMVPVRRPGAAENSAPDYYIIRGTVYDLLYRAQLADSHNRAGKNEPMLLFPTVTDNFIKNYDDYMKFENEGWYTLNQIMVGDKREPSEAVIMDIRKANIEVMRNPAKYAARFGLSVTQARAQLAQYFGFVNEGLEKVAAGVQAERPETYERKSLEFTERIMSMIDVREGTGGRLKAQVLGWSRFRNEYAQYWLQRIEALGPGKKPKIEIEMVDQDGQQIPVLKSIDFLPLGVGEGEKPKTRDLSMLRHFIADITHEDLSNAYYFPYRLDHWVREAAKEPLPAQNGETDDEKKQRDRKNKRREAMVQMGIEIELMILASMIYLNRYRYEPLKNDKDKTLAQYDEIALKTISGHEPLSPVDLISHKHIMVSYIHELVRSVIMHRLGDEVQELFGVSSPDAIPDEYVNKFIEEARSQNVDVVGKGKVRDRETGHMLQGADMFWYTDQELGGIIDAQYKRLGLIGSYQSLAYHMKFARYRLNKIPTAIQLHKQDQQQEEKKK